jgi:hypothetical protein
MGYVLKKEAVPGTGAQLILLCESVYDGLAAIGKRLKEMSPEKRQEFTATNLSQINSSMASLCSMAKTIQGVPFPFYDSTFFFEQIVAFD